MSARSYLYVPGDRPEMLAQAHTRGADALIVDLEDAVAPERKDEARRAVAAWLAEAPPQRPPAWVRVNAGDELEIDLAALKGTPLAGIVVPKVASADDVGRARAMRGDAPLCALIETAAGVLDARAIASAPGVVRLALGEADLGAELGMDPSDDGREWLAVRTTIVLASAAAGIEPPVGPVSTDLGNAGSLRGTTDALRRLGFGSRAAIHPAQVAVINEVFTPTSAQIEAATRLLAAAAGRGGGAFRADGRMVDEAVLRTARSTLQRAGIDPASVEAADET